jgi:hypothetical protein
VKKAIAGLLLFLSGLWGAAYFMPVAAGTWASSPTLVTGIFAVIGGLFLMIYGLSE